MPDTVSCTAELTVELPQARALEFFTPLGERRWAPGWDPAFPAPGRTVGPGTVFRTEHGEDTTTWIMVDHNDRGVRYARVSSTSSAGTVEVTVVHATSTRTRLRVRYDLTALSVDGEHALETLAAGFGTTIAHWETAIAAAASEGGGN